MNKKILIILAVVVVIMFMKGIKKEGMSTWTNKESCVSGRQNMINNGWDCVAPCVEVSSSQSSCLNGCGAVANPGDIISAYEAYNSCWSEYDDSSTFKCWMDCLYGGGSPSYGSSCTSAGDIYTRGTCTNDYGFTIEDQCKWSNEALGIGRKYYSGHGIQLNDYTCSEGCSNALGTCIPPPIGYTDFISYKNSYLAGGSFSTFISDANNWVIA